MHVIQAVYFHTEPFITSLLKHCAMCTTNSEFANDAGSLCLEKYIAYCTFNSLKFYQSLELLLNINLVLQQLFIICQGFLFQFYFQIQLFLIVTYQNSHAALHLVFIPINLQENSKISYFKLNGHYSCILFSTLEINC